ncbi:hypothetical protein SAMN05444050_4055 [Afipia sp. GAS231]|nr:hypothetical protein SAMN05444050_4055 [Afipia sp. GAS231]
MRSKIYLPGPHPLADPQRPWGRDALLSQRVNKENAMKRTLIRYKTKPEMAEKNAELVAAVFAELKAAQLDGVRYMTLRLEDDTFIHFVESATDDGSSPLPKLAAFQAFQSGIRDRCVEPPMPRGATVVGNYRMLGET